MKKIGLIGGLSWESTAPYYKILNEVINKNLGGSHSADCILHSIDFHEVESTITKGEWERSNYLLLEAAQKLEKAGAEFITICSNTMHKCVPEIKKKTNIPLLHIVDSTSKAIKKRGINSALLLGTRFTMEEEFNKSKFERNGVKITTPDLKDRMEIHNIIFKELCKGKIKKESKEKYIDIINKYCPNEAECVILGCTEIGLLIEQRLVDVPVFDTTLIHAEHTALYALGKSI